MWLWKRADETVDEFLQFHPPSATSDYDFLAAHRLGERWVLPAVPQALQHEFDDIMASPTSSSIRMEDLLPLFEKHKVLSGKWIASVRAGEADEAWRRVVGELVDGELGDVAQVTALPRGDRTDRDALIGVHTASVTDPDDAQRVASALRRLGLRCGLTYKPHAATMLRLYNGNKVWGKRRTTLWSIQEGESDRLISISRRVARFDAGGHGGSNKREVADTWAQERMVTWDVSPVTAAI